MANLRVAINSTLSPTIVFLQVVQLSLTTEKVVFFDHRHDVLGKYTRVSLRIRELQSFRCSETVTGCLVSDDYFN